MSPVEVTPCELACDKCGRTTFWCECHSLIVSAPQTFAVGDIAAFARQVEIAAGDQGALWHEGV